MDRTESSDRHVLTDLTDLEDSDEDDVEGEKPMVEVESEAVKKESLGRQTATIPCVHSQLTHLLSLLLRYMLSSLLKYLLSLPDNRLACLTILPITFYISLCLFYAYFKYRLTSSHFLNIT